MSSIEIILPLKEEINFRIISLRSIYVSDIDQEKWKKIGQAGLKDFYGVVQLTNHCMQQINNQTDR